MAVYYNPFVPTEYAFNKDAAESYIRSSRMKQSNGLNLTGSNWNKLVARSKSSSRSGLTGTALTTAQNTFGLLSGVLPQLSKQVINAQPNQNVLNNLAKLNEIVTQNWIRNYRPAVNQVVNQTITNLADRGIIDSSVASRTLAGVSSNYLNNLANLQSQLETERINKALNYPLNVFKTLGAIATGYGALSRVSTSNASSYNPSPAVGFLTRLIGI